MPFLPFIPFANCAEVVMQGVHAGQPAYLTFGCLFTAPPTVVDLTNLIAIFDGWYHSSLQALTAPAMAYNNIKATDLTTSTGPVVNVAVSGTQQGTGPAPSVPTNTALVVTCNTALRGRSYRGRNYVPGMPAAGLVNDNTWNATQYSAVGTSWGTLGGLLNVGGWQHVVLSRYLNNVRRTTGVATPILTYRGNAKIGTMRRRTFI